MSSTQIPLEEQIKERYQALLEFYGIFIKNYTPNYSKDCFLCPEIVYEVVKSYFDDIYRYKDYAGSTYADQHKQSAYSIKWISKLRPIQLTKDSVIDKNTILINSSFALYVGFSFLKIDIGKITPKFFQHLLYTSHYRNISGRQLATTLYILECSCNDKTP